MMHVEFPYQTHSSGRTATTHPGDYVRDLIEQVLFTVPGERVNRPEFGCGLAQLVFAGNSDELATATQALIQGALQQWLSEIIIVDGVEVRSDQASLNIAVNFRLRSNQMRQTEVFEREFGP